MHINAYNPKMIIYSTMHLTVLLIITTYNINNNN